MKRSPKAMATASAWTASASAPSFAMKYVSMSPTAAWANITSTLGAASRSSVPTMDPSTSRRVRGSNRGILGSGASTSLRAPFSTTSASRTSASMRLLPVERHARRRRPGHEALVVVGEVTLDEAHSLPGFHEAPDGSELGGPHRLQEIDLQLDGREGLAFRQRACVGDAHGRIGDVAEHAAVKCAHRIRVLPARRQLDHRLAGRDRGQRESDQRRDGGRGTGAVHELAKLVDRRRHGSLLQASGHYAMIPPSTVTIVPVVH